MRITTAVIALSAIAIALPLSAAQPQAMNRDAWTGPITPGSVVRVVNPYGDVRLRHGGSDDALDVAAVLQQLSTDGSHLKLDVAVTDEEAVVSVLRLDHQGNPAPEVPRGDAARTDLAVLVPEGHRTVAETSHGLLEVRGVKGDVDLRTEMGTIRANKVHGAITAHSTGGTIEVTLEESVTKNPQRFSSTTGPITVFTPPGNDLDVTMSTSGTLTTDFTLLVENHDDREPNKTATATVGAGGVPLEMTSKRGDLALRRVVTTRTD